MSSTATTYAPVTITRIDRADWDGELVSEGQHIVYGAIGFTREQFEALGLDEDGEAHPVELAWEKVLDEVFEELHPKIADLFYKAVNKRLPWTWEPER